MVEQKEVRYPIYTTIKIQKMFEMIVLQNCLMSESWTCFWKTVRNHLKWIMWSFYATVTLIKGQQMWHYANINHCQNKLITMQYKFLMLKCWKNSDTGDKGINLLFLHLRHCSNMVAVHCLSGWLRSESDAE